MMRAVLPSLAAVVLLAFAIARFPPSRMPQVVKGDDALSVAFADAKATISAAMVQKADSYFHGGIDMECPDRRGKHDEHGDEVHAEHCKGGHNHDEHCHDGHCDEGHSEGFADIWRWINRRLRAPERHVHLEGSDAVEMMPWFWASVKSDPHNIEAWTAALYVADKIMKDGPLAQRIIAEAIARNPDSLELACSEAVFVYGGGKGDPVAARRLFEKARILGKKICGGNLAELKPNDAETYCRILDYLSAIYAGCGERQLVPPLVEEVRATYVQTPVLEWMVKRCGQP